MWYVVPEAYLKTGSPSPEMSPQISFKSRKKFQMSRKIITVAAIFSVIMIASCHSYYRARHINGNRAAASIDSLAKTNRFLILRNGGQAWYMRNIAVAPDQRTANCILEPLPFEHSLHILNGIDGKWGYKKNGPDRVVINEVHFYTQKDSTVNAGPYTLQLERIYKIEVLEHDVLKTTTNYIVGTVGVVLGVTAISLMIIAAANMMD